MRQILSLIALVTDRMISTASSVWALESDWRFQISEGSWRTGMSILERDLLQGDSSDVQTQAEILVAADRTLIVYHYSESVRRRQV